MRRGNKDGKTIAAPSHDLVSLTKKQALVNLDNKMASKVCEDLFFKNEKISENPQNDLAEGTAMIRNLLMHGMFEDSVGLLFFRNFKDLGDEQKELVDKQAGILAKESYKRVKNLLVPNKNLILFLAKRLVEKETMGKDEILELIKSFNQN